MSDIYIVYTCTCYLCVNMRDLFWMSQWCWQQHISEPYHYFNYIFSLWRVCVCISWLAWRRCEYATIYHACSMCSSVYRNYKVNTIRPPWQLRFLLHSTSTDNLGRLWPHPRLAVTLKFALGRRWWTIALGWPRHGPNWEFNDNNRIPYISHDTNKDGKMITTVRSSLTEMMRITPCLMDG